MFGLGSAELTIIFITLLVFLIPGIIGAIIAKGRGRSAVGWFILCTAIPFAILLVIFMKPGGPVPGKLKTCIGCQEIIKIEANICKYCQTAA